MKDLPKTQQGCQNVNIKSKRPSACKLSVSMRVGFTQKISNSPGHLTSKSSLKTTIKFEIIQAPQSSHEIPSYWGILSPPKKPLKHIKLDIVQSAKPAAKFRQIGGHLVYRKSLETQSNSKSLLRLPQQLQNPIESEAQIFHRFEVI